jgi:hypothetical protein
MKMIVQFHIFRPKFSRQNSLFVHKLRTTTVKLNSVSQKQFLVSTVVLMTAPPLPFSSLGVSTLHCTVYLLYNGCHGENLVVA